MGVLRPAADRPAAREARVRRADVRRSLAVLDSLHEPFSGELVLHDLDQLEPDQHPQARIIMIRFLAAQFLTNTLRGDWPEHLLRLQRSAALNALGTGSLLDRELRLLRSALQHCTGEWPPAAAGFLLRSAAAARLRTHQAGALALYRLAYELAVGRGWWAEAAAAALEIATFGALLGDAAARTHWQRRARVLARLHLREVTRP